MEQTHYEKNKARYLERNKIRRERNKEYILNYLQQHPCIDCGEPDILTLEFDHRNPTKKTGSLHEAIKNIWSIERIDKEIAKCDVVCANCHRKRTANMFGSYRLP